MSEQPAEAAPGGRPGGQEWALGTVLGLCALAALLAGGAWWLWSNWSAPAGARGAATAGFTPAPRPVPADRANLAAAALRVGHEVVWLGEQPGRLLEVTVSGTSVSLRYLPPGQPIGSAEPALSVGTYAQADPQAALRAILQTRPGRTETGPRGTLVVSFDDSPTSAYVADPDSDVLVEVYDPAPRNAWAIATSGALRTVAPGAAP